MKARMAICVAVAGALFTSAACATSGGEHPNVGSSAASTPVLGPVRFDTSAGVALPPEATDANTALHQTTAFINTPHGVIVFDTATAKTVGVLTAPHQADTSDASNFYRPVSGTVDGTQVMLIMVPVSQPGQAANSDTQPFDVLLIDASSGALRRTVSTVLKRPAANRPAAWAVAVAGNDLIVNNVGSTSRISLTDGALRWTATSGETITAAGDEGNRLIGATAIKGKIHLQAIDADTGGTLWSDPTAAGTHIGINPAGPRFVVAASQNFTKIVNVDTGETTAALEPPTVDGLRCFYDQQATTFAVKSAS